MLELPGDVHYELLWDPSLHTSRFEPAVLQRHPRATWHEHRWAPLAPASPWRVGSWLRRCRPDVYLSPFYAMPWAAPCACALTIHDVWPLRLPGGLSGPKQLLYRHLLGRASRAALVLTSSRFSFGEITALTSIDPSRVSVVPLGAPAVPADPEVMRPEGLPPGPFVLVVGTNHPHKNLGLLARLWADLGDVTGVTLVAVGPEDSRYPGLDALSAASGASRVKVLGRVRPAELEWLYRNARLLLLPTRYEGFGLPLLEAGARGLPVVAADIPPLREIGEGAARFCDPDDVASWRREVLALLDDEGQRRELGEAGRARAAACTYARTASETLGLLESIARGGREGAG